MNLNDLLNYQKADMRIKAIYADLNKSEEKQKVETIKNAFNDAKKKMLSSEAQADKIMSAYNDAVKVLEQTEKEIEKLSSSISDAQDKNAIINRLEELKKTLSDTVQKINALKTQSENAIKLYAVAQKEGKKYKEEYAQAKAICDEKEASVQDEIKSLEKEVKDLRGKVDEQLLAQYDAMVAQNIRNPFVQAIGNEKEQAYMCGGCFMALSKNLVESLNDKGYCHCDSCKRIIYKG